MGILLFFFFSFLNLIFSSEGNPWHQSCLRHLFLGVWFNLQAVQFLVHKVVWWHVLAYRAYFCLHAYDLYSFFILFLYFAYLLMTCILLFVAQPQGLALYWVFNEYFFYLGSVLHHYHKVVTDMGFRRIQSTLASRTCYIVRGSFVFHIWLVWCSFLLVNIFSLDSLLKLVN